MAWPALVAAAPYIGAGIAAGGSIAAGLIGRKGADDAGKIANKMQKRLYKKSRPWRKAGENALAKFMEMLETGPGDFLPEEDPGYLYGYKRMVEDPITRSASVRGRLFDPSTQKALGREAQDYASTKYDNFLSRYYQKISPYFQVSESGRQATTQTGGQASGLTPYQMDAKYGETNALMAMTAGLSNIGQKAADYYGTQNILNKSDPYSTPPTVQNPNALRWSPRQQPGF